MSCTISFWYSFSDSSCCHYILLRLSERDGCLSSSSSKVVIIGLVHPPLKRFRSPPANHLVSTKFSLFPCMHEGLILCSSTLLPSNLSRRLITTKKRNVRDGATAYMVEESSFSFPPFCHISSILPQSSMGLVMH